MRKTYISIVSAIASALVLSSCSDFLDKQSSAYESDGFFQSEYGFEQGLTATYLLVSYDQNWAVPPIMVQDLYTPFALQETENRTISAGAGLTPDQSYVNTFWKGHWNIVSRANTILDGALTDRDKMSPRYRQLLAEAKVVRAYGYYYLLTTFGDIPFFTHAITPADYTVGRTAKEDIADYIIAELSEIVDNEDLQWTAAERGRVDRATAALLLSRYCLFAGSLDFRSDAATYFQKAADAAKAVMDHRHLATNFADLFTLAGQLRADVRDEMIWEISYAADGRKRTHKTRFGHTSRTAGGSSVRFPSMLLADTYECRDGRRIDDSPIYDNNHPTHNRDLRFRQTFLAHGDTMKFSADGGEKVSMVVINAYDDKTGIYPNPRRPGTWGTAGNADVTGTSVTFAQHGSGLLWNKYNEDLAESFSDSSCDISLMRAAEAYLTYAEAMIELGHCDDPTVAEAINTVRRRAKQPEIGANACVPGETLGELTVEEKFRQRVRRERKVEFAMEGMVFTDMRRWQIGDICNEYPSYGNPKADIRYKKDASNPLDINNASYPGLEPTDIPDYRFGLDPHRSDINDIAHYEHYKDKLRVRDANRYWAARFQWWPIPSVDTDRNPNLSNPDYE